MNQLELSDFEPHIGTVFSLREPVTADLVLTGVKAYELNPRDSRAKPAAAGSGKYRKVPFSVFFEDERSEYLPQGQYSLHHPAFTEGFEIFISCLGPNEKGTGYIYEAVFG